MADTLVSTLSDGHFGRRGIRCLQDIPEYTQKSTQVYSLGRMISADNHILEW